MINLKKIKTILLKLLGLQITSFIQALRFLYLLKKKKSFDAETKMLDKFLSTGDIAVDIGANGANWTYCLHKAVTASGVVFAFEADPYYAKATDLAIKMMKMKNVFLFPFGLSDKIENVPLRIKNSNGMRYAGMGFVDKNADPKNDNIEMVNLKTLDSLINEYPGLESVKLIKCDVEGYELFVFMGSVEILKKTRPIIVLEVGNYEKHNYDGSLLYNFFKDIKYTAYALSNDNKLSETDLYLNHKNALSVNRILMPNEKIKLFENILQ